MVIVGRLDAKVAAEYEPRLYFVSVTSEKAKENDCLLDTEVHSFIFHR